MTTSVNDAPPSLAAAMRNHQAGDLPAARKLYLSHLEDAPDDAPAWCLLAALEGQAGDHQSAGTAFRKAIDADPRHAPGYAGLGTSLLLGGDPAAAVSAYREALSLQPDLMDIRAQLALALHRLGRLDESIAELRDLVARRPDDLRALTNLGMTLLDRGDALEARDLFTSILAKTAELPQGWIGLASAQMRMDQLTDADTSLTRALALMPANPAGRTKLGNLLRKQGRGDEARRCLEAALATDPQYVPAIAALADMDQVAGNWQAGLNRIVPLLDTTSRLDVPLMTTAASLWIQSGAWQEAADRIAQWLSDDRLPAGPRADLERMRGDALDRLGQSADAWTCWTDANRRTAGRFDPDDFDRTVDALIAAFDSPAVADDVTGARPRPLLIVGMPRSGKSILEQLLASHPAIHGAGERRVAGTLTELTRTRTGAERPYPDCVQDLDTEAAHELADWYGDALRQLTTTTDWVTDTQPTNYLHLGLVHRLRPDMRVVYCRRRPLDLAWACYARGIPDRALAFTLNPDWFRRYAASVERLMDHWTQRMSIPVLTVDYESLVAQPETETRRVLSFLDLDWDPGCAEYARPGVATLHAPPAVHRPLDTGEIGRGSPYREQLLSVLRAPDDARVG